MATETTPIRKRRAEKALSAQFVKTVTEPGKHFDGHGLFLRVAPNGAKQWVQRIVIRGKRTELGLGAPPLVSLAEARVRAFENRKLARDGGDPLAAKRMPDAEITFAQAVERYLAAKLAEFRNDKHRKQWRATLDGYAAPVIGDRLVSEIDMPDILRVLEPIWTVKTETASRLRGRIEAVLSWATVAGYRSGDNPARWKGNLSEMLPKPSKVAKSGNHPAVALDDAPRWWAELQAREGIAARALAFAAMTAARSGEVRGMRWTEVDMEKGIWIVPAARMKMGREHRVPLTGAAMALLEALPRIGGCDLVFPAPRGGMMSDMTLSAVMRRMQEAEEKAGRPGFLDPRSVRPAVPHGLRSAFRDWAAERTEFPGEMAEIALAHSVGDATERAYRRGDMVERRRRMMEAWGRFLRGEASPVVIDIAARG